MTFFDILKKNRIPRLETEILIAFLLKKNREFLLTHPDIKITPTIFKKYQALVEKRLAGWSVATLIGEKEFYGRKFIVDKNVLIPRPETELLVDEVLRFFYDKTSKPPFSVVDIGTGSGVIVISLALELFKKDQELFDKIRFRGVDICSRALKIALKNSTLYKQDRHIKFLQGNLLEPLINKDDWQFILNNNLIITANLPYLSPQQITASQSIKKEPRLALVAGADGLKYYRRLFKQIAIICQDEDASPKRSLILFCEIDPGQAKSITALAKKALPDNTIVIKKDLAGKNRLAIISVKHN